MKENLCILDKRRKLKTSLWCVRYYDEQFKQIWDVHYNLSNESADYSLMKIIVSSHTCIRVTNSRKIFTSKLRLDKVLYIYPSSVLYNQRHLCPSLTHRVKYSTLLGKQTTKLDVFNVNEQQGSSIACPSVNTRILPSFVSKGS